MSVCPGGEEGVDVAHTLRVFLDGLDDMDLHLLIARGRVSSLHDCALCSGVSISTVSKRLHFLAGKYKKIVKIG